MNDPVNFIDPSGKNPAFIPAFAVGFVGGFIFGGITQYQLNHDSSAKQIFLAGVQSGLFTGAGAALAASGVGLVAAVAGEATGLGLNVATAPSNANVSPQGISNGINGAKANGQKCPSN